MLFFPWPLPEGIMRKFIWVIIIGLLIWPVLFLFSGCADESSVSATSPSSQYKYKRGQIVLHKLGGRRGIVKECSSGYYYVRFSSVNKETGMQSFEDVSAEEYELIPEEKQ
jgi:hypothetical protein